MPASGNSRLGTSWVTKRLPNSAASASDGVWRGHAVLLRVGCAVGTAMGEPALAPGREHQGGADEEAHGAESVPATDEPGARPVVGAGQDVAGERRGHEQHRSEHVDPGDPPRQRARLRRRGSGPTPRGCRTRSPRGTAIEPKRSGRQTCRSCSAAVALWARAARVLTLKNSVPGNCVAAASQLRSCGSQPSSRTGAGTVLAGRVDAVMPGLCAWTSCRTRRW